MKAGWQTKKLGDVCVTIQDGAHESPQRQFDRRGKGRFLYITSKNIRNNCLDLGNVSYVEEDFHSRIYPRCRPSVGDVLLTKDGANTGNVTLNTLDEPFSLLSSVCLIKTKADALKPGFLSYYIQSPDGLKSITGQMTGAAIKRIILRDIKLAPIPIPSLPEQHRIVGILDEAFDGLARAVANAEQNLRNARALFESHLQSVFAQRGEGWVEKHLKEVCEKITDGTHQTPKYFDEGIVFLSSRNVTSGTIDWGHIKYIDMKQHLEMHKRVAPRRDDILLAKNGTTGVAAIVDRDTSFDIYVSLALLRALPVIRPRFLFHFINSPAAKTQFNKRLKGVGVPNLHLEEIREVRLSFPADVRKQDRVIAELDEFRAETQRLESIYQQKIVALGELKKSLLHRAFNGDL